MTRHVALFVSLVAAAAACTSAPDGGADDSSYASADTTTTPPDFVFDGAWGYHGDGTRTPGVLANIVYDTSRLPLCRATQDGVAAWAIAAYVSADGGPAATYALPTGQTGSAVTVPIEIPYATNMAIWFEATDDSGCTQWDSNYGNNFTFSVDAPTDSVIHFEQNFTTSVQSAPGNDYALEGGQSIDIDYNFARLPMCRSYGMGNVPVWAISMFYEIDGAAPVSVDLTEIVDEAFAVPQPGHIALPAGAQTLALWFENSDGYGCNAWDSDYGQNYTFAIH